MKIGIVIPNTGEESLEAVKRMPQVVEELGYHSAWMTDHIIGVRSLAEFNYGAYWLEALSVMSYMAASTSRVRLGIGVLVLPVRNPVYTAKVISTIDNLSDGRVDLGIGTGWAKSEFFALGAGELHEQRGAVTNEALDLMLRCWEGGEFGFEGEFFNVRRINFEPVTAQRPHPPLWIGTRGWGKAPMQRAVKYADYWHPTGMTPDQIREHGDQIDEAAGRKIPRTARIHPSTTGEVSALVDLLAEYKEVGCVEMALNFEHGEAPIKDVYKAIEALATRMVALA